MLYCSGQPGAAADSLRLLRTENPNGRAETPPGIGRGQDAFSYPYQRLLQKAGGEKQWIPFPKTRSRKSQQISQANKPKRRGKNKVKNAAHKVIKVSNVSAFNFAKTPHHIPSLASILPGFFLYLCDILIKKPPPNPQDLSLKRNGRNSLIPPFEGLLPVVHVARQGLLALPGRG